MAANASAFNWNAPLTAESLHAALNLGWSMAELRGRLRYGNYEPPGTVDYQFARELHALPLAGEHSLPEQLIATRVATSILAYTFDVDQPLEGRNERPSAVVENLARDLGRKLNTAEAAAPAEQPKLMDDHPTGSDVGRAWNAVTEAIYRWDETIQDRLSVSVELLGAYQLGRGLSEAFWALDPRAAPGQEQPTDPPRPCSWEFLLGQHRCDLLTAQLKALERLLPALSIPAVKGPLAAWSKLVTDREIRNHADAITALRRQLQLWHDVLLGARDPLSLAKDISIRVGRRQVLRVLDAFAFELTIAVISIGLLAGVGYYLGANKTSSGWSVAIAILGFFGVTGAGLLARAKTQARALFVHLRTAFYQDVISDKATILPAGVKR